MITTEEMMELEQSSSLSSQDLMENAGRAVFNILNERYSLGSEKILIVCYHGNNGGDGFVAARYLSKVCSKVNVLFIGNESKLSLESRSNLNRLKQHFPDILLKKSFTDITLSNYTIIVDAVFGYNFKGEITGDLENVINMLNSASAFKISIDLPSGFEADTGRISKVHFNADLIITFHDLKPCLIPFKDKVVVVDIGLG